MSRNLKFARNLLLDAFVIGSFVLGIGWLTTLGVLSALMRSLPESPAKRRPHWALIILCLVLFAFNFLDALKRQAVFTRTPPEDWLITVCLIAGGLALIGETVCWREDRPRDLRRPEDEG
ncbi:MAG TPA: hypothetical protein VMB21_16020 [Candidatus Limnocylindria bacterium]|jgi:hypothetical protein|nr:hypothetical protein [Candidatus Limnocylindria bacterium]